jgi:tetratricopeptide (TPR) repeat protein
LSLPGPFRMRHFFLLAAALAVSCAASLTAAAPAVRIEPAACVIIAPARPNAVTDYAVQELQAHLLLVTGRTVPIAAAVQPGQFPFYIGAAPATDATALAAEEARWEISPAGVWLYGKDEIHGKKASRGGSAREVALASDTEAGTLLAVYEFLENALGVKWIEPGDAGITYRAQSPLALTPGKGAWVPQLAQRHMRTAYKDTLRERALADAHIPPDMQFTPEEFARRQQEESIWRRRMRMGGDVNFTYGHAFRDWWARYGKTHPEYFALGKNGKRGPESSKTADRVKMCVSNPDLVKQIVKDHFAAHRGLVVNACENDSRNFCRCPQCLALDVRLPGEENLDVDDAVLTDRYVHFTNAVLREAKKVNPAAKTVFYAYSRYNLPPRRERLDDDVIMFMLPNLAMTQQELTEYFAAWKKANAKVTFMRPNDLCQDTGLPLGFEQAMFEKYRMGDRYLSLKGTDYDTCWGFWPVSGITNYIMARGFYRPDRSFENWNAEYCATYGEARDDIAAYHAYWRQVWNRRVMGNLDRINAMTETLKLLRNKNANLADLLYEERDFDQTDAYLESALKHILTPGERRRINTLILANQHNRLTYRATAANRVGSSTPEAAQRQATQALYDFRREHRLDLNMHWELLFYLENAYGDNAGFERLLGTESPKMRTFRLEMNQQVAGTRRPDEKPLR